MSLSHSELCHHRKCALISLIALMMAASSEKHPTKIHNQPPLEAPGCRRLRVYAKMWKEEPWCQRFSVWWSKKIKQTKKDWADSRVRLAPAPEDQGQRNRAGIRTRKIQRKKDIRLPEAWNCSQHILFFPPRRHPNNVPSQFWSIFTKEMWKSVCCLELNIQELDVKGVRSWLIASLM